MIQIKLIPLKGKKHTENKHNIQKFSRTFKKGHTIKELTEYLVKQLRLMVPTNTMNWDKSVKNKLWIWKICKWSNRNKRMTERNGEIK